MPRSTQDTTLCKMGTCGVLSPRTTHEFIILFLLPRRNNNHYFLTCRNLVFANSHTRNFISMLLYVIYYRLTYFLQFLYSGQFLSPPAHELCVVFRVPRTPRVLLLKEILYAMQTTTQNSRYFFNRGLCVMPRGHSGHHLRYFYGSIMWQRKTTHSPRFTFLMLLLLFPDQLPI